MNRAAALHAQYTTMPKNIDRLTSIQVILDGWDSSLFDVFVIVLVIGVVGQWLATQPNDWLCRKFHSLVSDGRLEQTIDERYPTGPPSFCWPFIRSGGSRSYHGPTYGCYDRFFLLTFSRWPVLLQTEQSRRGRCCFYFHSALTNAWLSCLAIESGVRSR